MVKPADVPEHVDEMDVVKPEQEKTITELLASLREANNGQLPYLFAREEDEPARRDLAYKFLKARRWNLKNALGMVQSTVQFRKEHGLDSWRLFPSAFPLLGYDEADIVRTIGSIPGAITPLDGRTKPSEWDVCYRALQSSYVNVYHYWDKGGHPVLYDCCGKADVSGILSRLEKATPVGKGLRDIIVPYHTYMNEVQYYVIRYANAKAKAGTPLGSSTKPTSSPSPTDSMDANQPRKIMGITVVLDADGMHLGMLQKRFISIVRDIFAVDQGYYPEVLHRLFVINCPTLIHTAYSFVKSALDENTRKKVIFCNKSESLDVLRRVIDDDKIPQELGGGCRCKGGCLPRYKDTEEEEDKSDGAAATATRHSSRAAVEVPTENITIKAGKKLTRDIFLHAGEEISWQFALENADVQFSASFEASPGHDDAQASPLSPAGHSSDKADESVLESSVPSRQFFTPVSAASPIAAPSLNGALSPSGASICSHKVNSPIGSGSPCGTSLSLLADGATSPTKRSTASRVAAVDSIDATPAPLDASPPSTAAVTPPKPRTDKGSSGKKHSGSNGGGKKHKDPNATTTGTGTGTGSSSSVGVDIVDIKREKLSADVDSYRAAEDGVLHLRWDNGHSWMTSKKIQLRVFSGCVE